MFKAGDKLLVIKSNRLFNGHYIFKKDEIYTLRKIVDNFIESDYEYCIYFEEYPNSRFLFEKEDLLLCFKSEKQILNEKLKKLKHTTA